MGHRLLGWFGALGLAAVLSGCGVLQSSDAPDTPRCQAEPTGPYEVSFAEVNGVNPNELLLDVYLPEGCGPFQVVMWVHGGGWLAGDKRDEVVMSKVALARELGAALVSVNYRLSDTEQEIVWPGNAEDLAAAIAWIEKDSAEYNLDPVNLSAIGHSSGAHLISIVATDPQFLDDAGVSDSALKCVVSVDSTAYNMAAASSIEQVLIYRAFGDDLRVIREASPLVAVREYGAPAAEFLVVARGSDTRVAAQQQFVDEIVAEGGSATLVDVNPYDHSQTGWQIGVPGEQLVTPAVSEFLEGCLSTLEITPAE